MKETFSGLHAIASTPDNVLGILWLMFWALTLVVSIKYAAFVLRANNKGEGGIMALIALTQRATSTNAQVRWLLASLGLFGVALFYGDSMLTPAISVLSAIATRLPGMARWREKLFILKKAVEPQRTRRTQRNSGG